MPSTARGIPYPAPGQAPDIPAAMQALAEGVETRHLGITGAAAKRIHRQDYTATTTDANGFVTVSHAAGFTPTAALISMRNPSGSFCAPWGADTFTPTQARLRFLTAAGDGAAPTLSTGTFTVIFFE